MRRVTRFWIHIFLCRIPCSVCPFRLTIVNGFQVEDCKLLAQAFCAMAACASSVSLIESLSRVLAKVLCYTPENLVSMVPEIAELPVVESERVASALAMCFESRNTVTSCVQCCDVLPIRLASGCTMPRVVVEVILNRERL